MNVESSEEIITIEREVFFRFDVDKHGYPTLYIRSNEDDEWEELLWIDHTHLDLRFGNISSKHGLPTVNGRIKTVEDK